MEENLNREDFRINYRQDRHIDEENLHVEWIRHSEITAKYVFYYAQKKKEAELAKKEVDLKYAELDEKIRKNPEKYELDKKTDEVVKQAIKRQTGYQEKLNESIEAGYELGIAYGALQDMRERKEILSGLNYLYNTGYFDVPDTERNIATDRKAWEAKQRREREKQEKKEKEINDQIAGKLNKSKQKKNE